MNECGRDNFYGQVGSNAQAYSRSRKAEHAHEATDAYFGERDQRFRLNVISGSD